MISPSEIAEYAKAYSTEVETADAVLVFLPNSSQSIACLHVCMRDGTEEVVCCPPERDEMLQMITQIIESHLPQHDGPDDSECLPF